MQRVWLPALELAGLSDPRLTFHGLRHSAATAWVAAGVGIRTAQHRLGHSTPRLVLALYAHATTQADRDAADKVGALLFRRPEAGTPDDGRESRRAMNAP